MMHQVTKTIITVMMFFSLTMGMVYADNLDCDTITTNPQYGPRPIQILCPIKRGFNVAVTFIGVVFVGMLVWGGIKLAAAVGDPKGLDAARGTWTYAIVGTLIVISFFLFFGIVLNLLGITAISSPDDVFNAIEDFSIQFMCELGIRDNFITCP